MKMAFPPAWFVLTLGVVVLLAGTFELPLLDRDEPRFSRATVEMAERGNWVIPYFNGQYRFDKPPLTYWRFGKSFLKTGDEGGFYCSLFLLVWVI